MFSFVWVLWHMNLYNLFNAKSIYTKTVLFQTIQFNISSQFSTIWPIDRTLSSASTLSQSGIGGDGNEGVLHIPKSSSITGTSIRLFNDICRTVVRELLPLCRGAVGVYYKTSRVGHRTLIGDVLFLCRGSVGVLYCHRWPVNYNAFIYYTKCKTSWVSLT